ncbi:terminase small subunit [Aerococcus urinaeequi]|uniref:terminase small subunit n=1 Tax=Aerococcus urinaeequi TaxID=51665 RepID=UPI003D6B1FA3
MANLTPKQKKFADEYIITGNAYQSALNAGYSDNYAKNANAKMIEKDGEIRRYIEGRMRELEGNKIATADEVLQILTSIIRLEFIEEQQTINPLTGKVETLENKPTTKDVISASKELLKRYPTNVELKKLNLEIEKLQSQIGGNEQQDDKIADFISKLKNEVRDGN